MSISRTSRVTSIDERRNTKQRIKQVCGGPSGALGRVVGRPEDFLTKQCAQWVSLMRNQDDRFKLVFSVQNERKTTPRAGRQWNLRGRTKGVSDWIILCPSSSGRYHNGAIELKAGRNNVTPDQASFLATADKHGSFAAVIRSFEDFQRAVTLYMEKW